MENLVKRPFTAQPGFWRGKKVFVTGHTGFKGGWLAYWLNSLGAEITGFAARASRPSFVENVDCIHREGDIRDYAVLRDALLASRAEIVFHLAAQPLVSLSYEEPLDTCAVNVMGTANMLEACRHAPEVKSIVVVTSDKCYLNREWEWSYRESDALGGNDPYSASKAAAEIITASYRYSFFQGESAAGVATARAGNVFGGGDWGKNRIIPDAARAFHDGKKLSLRNPQAIRPWHYVLEPLSGYMRLAEALTRDKDTFARAWNFGPPASQLISVHELAQHFAAIWGEGASVEYSTEAKKISEAQTLLLDSGLALRQLGWTPHFPLQRALEHTAQWYKTSLRSPAELPGLMAAQLREFETFSGA